MPQESREGHVSCQCGCAGPPAALSSIVMTKASWPKFVGVTIAAALVLALGILLAVANRQDRAVCTPDGCIVKLERYEFRAGTVSYYLPEELQNRPVTRAVTGVLPHGLIKRLKFLPQPRAFVYSYSPAERLLSVAFSTQAPVRNGLHWPNPTVTRVVVSDDRGQSFDGVMNYNGSSSIL